MKFKSTKQLVSYLFENLEHGEGYLEAGELMSQTHPDVKEFLAQIGIEHIPPGSAWSDDQNNQAIELGKAIDSITSTETIPPTEIKDLKNLANKSGQEHLPEDIAKIGQQEGKSIEEKTKEYSDFMTRRDAGENRKRGYDVKDLVDKIVNGNYSPPVLINGAGGLVVVGGRTRLYAGLATNTPMKVKILNADELKQRLKSMNESTLRREIHFDMNRWKKMAGILKS